MATEKSVHWCKDRGANRKKNESGSWLLLFFGMRTFDHPAGWTCAAVGHPGRGVGTGNTRANHRGGGTRGGGAFLASYPPSSFLFPFLSMAGTLLGMLWGAPPVRVETSYSLLVVELVVLAVKEAVVRPQWKWHHSVEAPRCSLGRGKPASAAVLTLGEDRL